MTEEDYKRTISFMVGRLVSDADDVLKERQKERSIFTEAECLSYYKVLQSIKDSLMMADLNPEDFGLKDNLIEKILNA